MSSVQEVYDAVLDLDEEKVAELVKTEIGKGSDISQLLNEGLIKAMDEVGRRFSANEFYVPEMLMAAEAMKAGLDQIRPLLKSGGAGSRGTIVIGTVKGDLHDIGKNLVAMMMEGAGFEVYDLGIDVGAEKFIEAAKEKYADIVCMSALLTTTMPGMEDVIKRLKDDGLDVKTMVGGAPVTQAFAEKIGATGFGEDAPGAVETARRLLQ